ncbi:MAG TPA: phosphotransferase [Thermoanaerobaculia bacterium]|nr:phosphotransferase [Thermoanaerobaculia bacterium]
MTSDKLIERTARSDAHLLATRHSSLVTFPRIPDEFPGLQRLARRTRHDSAAVEVLPGDVGRRRYLRLLLGDGRSVLGVVYPAEETESRLRWNAARNVLRGRVRVPALIADDQEGNQLVEDFGRVDVATLLAAEPENRAAWLERAADSAALFAGTPDPGINPCFDSAFFRRELDLTREAVFELWLQAPLSASDRAAHDAWAQSLAEEIAAHPQVLCHRDYHGNNLFPMGAAVGAIDFQDLRTGPDSYDLASLLWERTTLAWMTPQVADAVIERFAGALGRDPGALRQRLERVLLQRAWKVCGTFARAVAHGRGEIYRSFLPGELRLVRRLLTQQRPDRAFRAVFEARLAAIC